MEFDPPVRTHARVIANRPDGVFDLELPNGKRVIGHLSKALKDFNPPLDLSESAVVAVEMTPFDFSKARITHLISPK